MEKITIYYFGILLIRLNESVERTDDGVHPSLCTYGRVKAVIGLEVIFIVHRRAEHVNHFSASFV